MIDQLLGSGRVLRIGHKGAAALAPENTLRSLEVALEHGVDIVEFDVLGDLRLGHSRRELPAEAVTLDDALAFLAGRDAGIHVDVKDLGAETAIVEALRRHGVEGRALVSSFHVSALRRFAELAPGLPRALSYPEDRYGLSRGRWLGPVTWAGGRALRRVLPLRIGAMLTRASATVASLHHSVVSRAAVARCHALGVPVIAWTIDDPRLLARMAAAGVDAVVSNDPRIFTATLPA